MPIFSKNKNNILFIHIPKTAGSSLEKIGTSLGWKESLSIRGKKLEEIKYFKSSLQHLHAKPLNDILDFRNFDSIFTIVRNPFTRFKSEYYWQQSQGITDLSVDDWVSDTFEKYKQNNYVYDNHIRPQVEFIPECAKVNIFKLEEDGVKSAKKMFYEYSNDYSFLVSTKKIFHKLIEQKKQEKRSVKNSIIEEQFEKHYQKIVDFYSEDYSTFSYKKINK